MGDLMGTQLKLGGNTLRTTKVVQKNPTSPSLKK
jgi:hypothetical protein